MSFVFVAALALIGLVSLPAIAHLLRRAKAKELEFPPASLVRKAQATAQRRRTLEDRLLFLLRALIIVSLALLGATPLIRCNRLNLIRSGGSSVALAIVVDDSLSMRAKGPSSSRFARAKDKALELLDGLRDGDQVAVVLAGTPPRLALGMTRNLNEANDVLTKLEPSDRSTDLAGAIQMARWSLKDQPQPDHRIVLLSDLKGEAPQSGKPEVWTPDIGVRGPLADCAVEGARTQGNKALARIRCSNQKAATGRKVILAEVGESRPLDEKSLEARRGTQVVRLKLSKSAKKRLEVRLSSGDSIKSDDRAPLVKRPATRQVGVVFDRTTSSVITGGNTVVEQALSAVAPDVTPRPMTVVPDDPKDLAPLEALIIDDLPGVTPEAEAALRSWLKQGGVALAFLGPNLNSKKLGARFQPFADSAVQWERTEVAGIDPKTMAWLGTSSASLADIKPKARALVDAALPKKAEVLGRWADHKAFAYTTSPGQGQLFGLGLPLSVTVSDLALRPGFLAILDHVLSVAARRGRRVVSMVGERWEFPLDQQITVHGPTGNVTLKRSRKKQHLTPHLAGHYEVSVGKTKHSRISRIDPQEISETAFSPGKGSGTKDQASTPVSVDVSRYVVFVLLGLLGAELILRLLRRRKPLRSEGLA